MAKHRRHLGIGHAGRTRTVVNDAPAQPVPLVADGEKVRTVGFNAYCREAAEMEMGRGELDAAAKRQRAEALALWIARLEDRDRPCANVNFGGLLRSTRIGLRGREESECSEQRGGERCAASNKH